jgi:hypothetical protein
MFLTSASAGFAQTNATPSVTPALAAPAAPPAVAPKDLSKGAGDIIKLFHAGKKDNVLIFYAQNAGLDYKLSADDIIYLKSVGLSENVITAMMEADKEREKSLAVRFDDDRNTSASVSAPPAETTRRTPPAAQTAAAIDDPQLSSVPVFPDYSSYPNYYGPLDPAGDSSPHYPRVSVSVGVGVGLGFQNGFYGGYGGYGGYYGHGGRFGGRR